MFKMRDHNRLPDAYPFRETMDLLSANNHRIAGGPNTMLGTLSNGSGFKVVHYASQLAIAYPTCVLVRTFGWNTRATVDRLNRVIEQYGWSCGLEPDGVKFYYYNGEPVTLDSDSYTLLSTSGDVDDADPTYNYSMTSFNGRNQ